MNRASAWLPVAALLVAVTSWVMVCARVDLWQPYEPDLVQTAREMWQRGDWLIPSLNDLPYYEKPPLYYWSAMLAANLAGRFTELTARVPSILGGAFGLVATFALGRRLFRPRTGWLAAAMYASTPVLIYCSTKGMTDALLGAAVLAALACFSRGLWQEPTARDRRRAFLLGWLALAFGFLAKGPVAVAFVLLTLLPEMVASRTVKQSVRGLAQHLPGAAAFVLIAAPWYVLGTIRNGAAFLHGALLEQNVGRFFELERGGGPLYYLENLPGQMGLWTLFLPAVVWLAWSDRVRWQARRFEPVRFLVLGVILQLVFLSAANGKIQKYLLPSVGLVCLLATEAIQRLAEVGTARARWLLRVPLVLAALVLLAAFALPAVIRSSYPQIDWRSVWAVAIVLALGGGLTFTAAMRQALSGVPALALTASCACLVVAASPSLMQINEIKSSRGFAERAATLLPTGVPLLGFRISACESLFLYYSGRSYQLVPSMQEIIAARRRLGRVFVLTRAAFFAELPESEREHFRVVLRQEDDKREYLLVEGVP